MNLRPATTADVDAVAQIWLHGWRDGHLGHVPASLVAARTPESFGSRAADRIADTTVAEIAGEVAGFVMLHDDEVEQVYVAASHRGTGVAPALIAEAERLVAAAGYPTASVPATATPRRCSLPNRSLERCAVVVIRDSTTTAHLSLKIRYLRPDRVVGSSRK